MRDPRSLPPPPRRVPPLVSAALLFGNVVTVIGAAVFSFGMIFFWVFALDSDAISWLRMQGHVEQVGGTVTRIFDTQGMENMSVGEAQTARNSKAKKNATAEDAAKVLSGKVTEDAPF